MKPDSQPDYTTTLINFRAPNHLKARLDQLCRFNHQSKTSVILTLIRDFIKDQSAEIDQELETKRKLDQRLEPVSQTSADEAPIETWNGYTKDPVSQTWTRAGE